MGTLRKLSAGGSRPIKEAESPASTEEPHASTQTTLAKLQAQEVEPTDTVPVANTPSSASCKSRQREAGAPVGCVPGRKHKSMGRVFRAMFSCFAPSEPACVAHEEPSVLGAGDGRHCYDSAGPATTQARSLDLAELAARANSSSNISIVDGRLPAAQGMRHAHSFQATHGHGHHSHAHNNNHHSSQAPLHHSQSCTSSLHAWWVPFRSDPVLGGLYSMACQTSTTGSPRPSFSCARPPRPPPSLGGVPPSPSPLSSQTSRGDSTAPHSSVPAHMTAVVGPGSAKGCPALARLNSSTTHHTAPGVHASWSPQGSQQLECAASSDLLGLEGHLSHESNVLTGTHLPLAWSLSGIAPTATSDLTTTTTTNVTASGGGAGGAQQDGSVKYPPWKPARRHSMLSDDSTLPHSHARKGGKSVPEFTADMI